jgi:hypothetical protein
MSRRIASLIALLSIGTVLSLVPSAHAQPGGGGCALQGPANFKPGLAATDASNFSYSFSGKLNPCQSHPSQSNPPSSGGVSAGKIIKISGARYQEPIPKGTGSCANGSTHGLALVAWNDRSRTVISYQTQSVTGGAFLGGSQNHVFAAVVPSVKLKRVGATGSKTIKTTRYMGAGGVGALTFSPNPDPTACNASGGVRSAGISGFVAIGSSQ